MHIVIAVTPDNSPIEYFLTNNTACAFTIYQDNVNSYGFEVRDALPAHSGVYNFTARAQKQAGASAWDPTADVQIRINSIPRLVNSFPGPYTRNNYDATNLWDPTELFVDDDGDTVYQTLDVNPALSILNLNETGNYTFFNS